METKILLPKITIVKQLLDMDKQSLAQLLVRCEKSKYLKSPKGNTEKEINMNYHKMEEEFKQEVSKYTRTYTKYGLVRELMKWATGFTYDDVYDYIPHEFDVLKRAAGFYKIKPNPTMTVIELEEVIFEHWVEYIINNLRKELDKHPEKWEKIAKTLERDLSPEEKKQLLKILKDKKVIGEEITTLEGKALLSAILAAGSGTATIIGLGSAGFNVYLALTKTIHLIFTELLGITLPFAVYTSATRALSLFLGPIGWVIFGVLTLIPFISHSRKKKTMLLALVFVPSIYLAYIEKNLMEVKNESNEKNGRSN